MTPFFLPPKNTLQKNYKVNAKAWGEAIKERTEDDYRKYNQYAFAIKPLLWFIEHAGIKMRKKIIIDIKKKKKYP